LENVAKVKRYLWQLRREKSLGHIFEPLVGLQTLKQGGELLCGELSLVYAYALHSLGYRVKYITTFRSLLTVYDTHAVIEFWDEKRKQWILSDLTFGIWIKGEDKYLSITDFYDRLHSNQANRKAEVVSFEAGRAPRLDKYYISYELLFNYVSIRPKVHCNRWIDLPLRQFFTVYQSPHETMEEVHIVNGLGVMILLLPWLLFGVIWNTQRLKAIVLFWLKGR
jgi:hypothetical protein